MATGVLNPLWAGVASPSPHHFHICPLGSRTKPVGSLQEGTTPALGSLQRVKVTVTVAIEQRTWVEGEAWLKRSILSVSFLRLVRLCSDCLEN